MPYLGNVLTSFNIGTNNIDNGAVTTEKIADGAIINADVNASAAIAGTKISPDFGSQTVQTTGIFSHALGTAGAPTVTFTGDTNTGIYSPGADQVAISTGGSGRLFINSSGQIGIGATPSLSSTYQLEINTSAGLHTYSRIRSGGTAYDAANVFFDGTNTALCGLLAGSGGATGGFAILNSGANPIVFGTSLTERLRITSAGLVGVGTSSPSAALEVAGQVYSNVTATNQLVLNTGGSGYGFIMNPSAGKWSLGYGSTLGTLGTSVLTWTNAGQVGIGTTTPGNALEVNGNIRSYTAAAGDVSITHSGLVSSITAAGSISLAFGANNSERARIDASGRLLVGTSSASGGTNARVLIAGNTNSAPGVIQIASTSASPASGDALGVVRFSDSGHTQASAINCERDGGTWTSGSSQPTRLVFSTTADGAASPTERLRIDSAGRVGIGTSSPGWLLSLRQDSASGGAGLYPVVQINNANAAGYAGLYLNDSTAQAGLETRRDTAHLSFYAGGNERARLDSSGRLGIGTQSPGEKLEINGVTGLRANSGGYVAKFLNSASTSELTGFIYDNNQDNLEITAYDSSYALAFKTNNTERMRLDTSGRMLVGTSSARTAAIGGSNQVVFEAAANYFNTIFASNNNTPDSSFLSFIKSRGTTSGSHTIVANGDDLGVIDFEGADGSVARSAARITAQVDGTPGSGDMPGRLVFSTTADGASSPTERMRITNIGDLTNKTSNIGSVTGTGFTLGASGYFVVTRSADCPVFINRETNDGNLIEFRQDGATEGNINVSGTTVALAGAHLSRWSQLPSGVERTEILRGSVLSNIDEMCKWGDEENEQLNRMKVSDVEGDKNVSGVFQAWDDDDDTYINDFYCAMTGDFIIRIGAGVTVERGDLLMSAGDGTAKPQDDDIIRSKTIAKVTSTHVTCTYDDGSYCVPCVLMAC